MKLNDQAQNGATIADAYVSVYRKVNSLIASDNKQYDYILLEGGCNDIHQSVPLGDITDEDYDVTNCDITTVCGALETIIFNLRTKWPQSNIIFITVHKMASRNWSRQVSYWDKILKVCDKWSIPVVDIFKEGQISSYIPALATTCFPTSQESPTGYDRTHPNELGYKNFYCPLIESKMKELNR